MRHCSPRWLKLALPLGVGGQITTVHARTPELGWKTPSEFALSFHPLQSKRQKRTHEWIKLGGKVTSAAPNAAARAGVGSGGGGKMSAKRFCASQITRAELEHLGDQLRGVVSLDITMGLVALQFSNKAFRCDG